EDDFEEPTHQEFETGVNDDQPEDEIHPHPDWFQKPIRIPSLDRDWNKTLPADHGPVQPCVRDESAQGKLSNLKIEERLAFSVSLRMFTRSIVIQRRVEDFQLGNKDKKNRLIRLDELHKFSDGTLDDVRTALDDRLKGIRMKYLPKTIWRQSDRERATAMIQAIDKRLKSRRIMQSLEMFVGGRPYEDSILQARNPVKEILLKLNLPDHRILKDRGEGT
ncbi:hypothetical protein Tco_0655080, partial [Tanacetum coccineum]